MSTHFFTNQPDNTLLEKFKGVFSETEVRLFDILVGFFRASGYFRLRPFFKDETKLRILVGIDIDKLVADAHRKGFDLFRIQNADLSDIFSNELRNDIQNAEYKADVETGMKQFIRDIAEGKVEIRIHQSKNIHAKIYIFRKQPESAHHGWGAVITGSSNLSEAGLSRNFEFNVELRNTDDIKFAVETFENLWQEGLPVSPDAIEIIEKETFLNDAFTPYEIYIKFLIEYFGAGVVFDPDAVGDLPPGFKKLDYQVDAVMDGFRKLQKHNGFFLADVVGLGKTVIAVMIAKKFYQSNGEHTRTLIVVPPQVEKSWRETVRLFDLRNVDFVTNGSLHKVKKGADFHAPDEYDLIIVDEAHKFRSDYADMYDKLQTLCKTPRKRHGILDNPNLPPPSKKIILVSATPLNNKPEDIRNLVYLFQDAKQSTLEVGNLQHFFAKKIEEYKAAKKEEDPKVMLNRVKTIYQSIREKIIQPLVVRRTRTDLTATEQYRKDLEKQNIHFPEILPPRPVYYELEPELEKLYDKTVIYLTQTLQYARYKAIGYLKPEHKKEYKTADKISNELAAIMRTLLIKRLDSSFYAFRQSLMRYREANRAMLTMFENGRIYIAPQAKVTEFIDKGEEEELVAILNNNPELYQTKFVYTPDDFEGTYWEQIKDDDATLQELCSLWENTEADPKLDCFVQKMETELFGEQNREGKLIVFSESKDTTRYLFEALTQRTRYRIMSVDSSDRKSKMEAIRANFDANIPPENQKNDFDILITTEVLAEGVNLHRSNSIVNYDTPWNSTRLMQRIGRVNRIGTLAPVILIYNFYPTGKVENDLELKRKAILKLQAFHEALGEDSQIYSEDEEFNSFGLFEKIEEPDEKDERLDYLMNLRKLKEQNPELFARIAAMPQRARCARKYTVLKNQSFVFLKNERREGFYLVQPNGEITELTFLEAAKQLSCEPGEKGFPLPNGHHEHVQAAYARFTQIAIRETQAEEMTDLKPGPNETKAINLLAALKKSSFATEAAKLTIDKGLELVTKGVFAKLTKELAAIYQRQSKDTTARNIHYLLDEVVALVRSYPDLRQKNEQDPQSALPRIVISESFIG
jgi:superfamily II DNA or RNA helicase